MKLFISNISFHACERDLRDLFLTAGYRVDSLVLPEDGATGKARGFAFVEIRDDETAHFAIADLDGAELLGRKLNVQKARERAQDHRRAAGLSG